MIVADNLHKAFDTRTGRIQAVSNVGFRAADGQITGLLGPNGAGKTTTMRMLYTLMTPDQGSISVDGIDAARDPVEVRRHLGVLPDARGVYKRLTARENIAYFGELHGLSAQRIRERIEVLSHALDMGDILDRQTDGFSQGQRTKTAIARALVHDPRNVILDEPTNGLDVMTTRALRRFLLGLREEGRCVILSSHIMQEVGALCDHIVIIAKGTVMAAGSADELRAQFIGAAGGHHRALGDDHDVVTQRAHLLHDVAGQDHAAAFLAQAQQETAQRARGHHVQAVGGFIEDDVARVVHQRTGDGGLGALALREAIGLAVEDVTHVQCMRQHFNALADALRGQAVQLAEVGDVLARGQALVDAARIGQHAKMAPHFHRVAGGVDAVDADAALVGCHQRVQHAHGGGLAGTIGAEQAGDLAIGGTETDVGHRLDTAGAGVEGLMQVVGDDHGVHPLNEVNAGT